MNNMRSYQGTEDTFLHQEEELLSLLFQNLRYNYDTKIFQEIHERMATMIKNALIIANPGSGKGEAPEYARKLEKVLFDTYDCTVKVRETTEVGDAEKWAKEAKNNQKDTVICLGGDGTVNEIVTGL